MNNLKWFKKTREHDMETAKIVTDDDMIDNNYRKIKALEIIAEELCKFNAREESKCTNKKEQVYVNDTPKSQIKDDIQNSVDIQTEVGLELGGV